MSSLSAPHTPMVVEKLGRYEIISELGRGAMGVVYKAIDPLIDRVVAIKTVSLNLTQSELADFEERFYREAKSAGRLNHPNIVTIHDIGKTEHMAYMAMEFLEGQQLGNLMVANIALSINKIARIAAQVADGLAYAHKNGVVHRDIKPANIMLNENGVVKITDFGIARVPTGSRTQAGIVLGSPKYMAPEQVVGDEVDGRSDIFSLGVVLYEMLTGKAPFDGDNISTIMYRILNETPPPPSSLNAKVSRGLDKVVLKALAKRPEDRYQDAKELAQRLRTWIKFDAHPGHSDNKSAVAKPSSAPDAAELPTILVNDHDALGKDTVQTPALQLRKKDERRLLAAGFLIGTAIVIGMSLIWASLFFGAPEPVSPVVKSFPAKDYPPPNNPLESPPPQIASAVNQALPEALEAPSPTAAKPPDKKTLIPEKKPEKTPVKENKVIASVTPTEEVVAKRIEKSAAPESILTFAISPWGEVSVDGKKYGVSPPLKELKLPPGKHRIEITNSASSPYVEQLELYPDSSKKIKHSFN